MIYCPKCGGQTGVYSTRETDRGLERRRECRECGARYKTVETVVREISPEEGKKKPG